MLHSHLVIAVDRGSAFATSDVPVSAAGSSCTIAFPTTNASHVPVGLVCEEAVVDFVLSVLPQFEAFGKTFVDHLLLLAVLAACKVGYSAIVPLSRWLGCLPRWLTAWGSDQSASSALTG
jgi:hypothetical protein